MKQNYCLNNIYGLQKMRTTVYRSTVLICRSLLISFLSIRNNLAPLCQQADLEAESSYPRNKKQYREEAKTFHPAWPELWQHTCKNGCFLRHQKLTSLHRTFLQPGFPREPSLHDHHVPSAPSPTCIFWIPWINGSRELPKTRVLTALTLGLAPLVASKAPGSAHSDSQLALGTAAAPGWAQHSSCLPGGSPAQPRGTQAAQALPWTSVLQNLEEQPVLLGGRVEEREEQIIDWFW